MSLKRWHVASHLANRGDGRPLAVQKGTAAGDGYGAIGTIDFGQRF